MAITRIHKITSTFEKAIDYCTKDKKEEHIKDDIADAISYATNDKVGETVYYTLNATQNCIGDAKECFKEVIESGRGKFYSGISKTTSGEEVLAWHLVQSFDTVIDPIIANEIGRKLAKEVFSNFPVTISTHTNTENTHNHLIICAWDLDGKKWNNCNENYRQIRETSDRLCDEYGLNVIEETRNQKLIRYEDKDGTIRYFEPTTRKVDLIKQREEGLISTDDVNSYRNTMSYEDVVMKEMSNKEIIKQDIDNLLDVATSYEHLLQMLRDVGYEIKDKKKNGEWREHVSFKNPTATKYVRDKSLSEDEFYVRKKLTAYIESMVEKRRERKLIRDNEVNIDTIPYFEDYTLERTRPNDINEDYRKVKDQDGSYRLINRTLPEKEVIRELKEVQKEAGVYDTYTINRLLEAQREARKKKRKFIPADRQQDLIMRIQDGYNNLKFIEQKNVQSFEQIKQVVASLYGQQQQCHQTIDKLDALVEHLESVLKTPQKLEETIERIQQKSNDPIYLEFEYETDKNLLQTYQGIIRKYKIDTPEGLDTLNTKINSAKIQVHKLGKALEINRDEIERYDRCIRVLERAELIRERERTLDKENIHDKTRDRDKDDRVHQREKKKEERER